jgi:hypothetical protein
MYKQSKKRAYVKINMEDLFIQLDDLPDEILIMILKKLENSDALYSLIGVNKRLDTIVQDSIFTSYLELTAPLDDLKKFTDTVLDRFCLKILPKIHHKIQFLRLESSLMERILLSTNYPNLHALGLYDLASETAKDLFTGKPFSLTLSMINYMRILK